VRAKRKYGRSALAKSDSFSMAFSVENKRPDISRRKEN
jgi:hypothetical protein